MPLAFRALQQDVGRCGVRTSQRDTADQKAGSSGAVRAQVPSQAGHRKRTVRCVAPIATAYGMPGTSLQTMHDAPTPWGVETGTPALTEMGHAESVDAGMGCSFYR